MRGEKNILAVVPARSGSKGIPNKNLETLGGISLIGRATRVLLSEECNWIDHALISTDSQEYADEAMRHGLDAPFLRPPELSHDKAGAIETMIHALNAAEAHYKTTFDIVLIVEPTCPLRKAEDVQGAVDLLIESEADSVVTVSLADTKFHPRKLLRFEGGMLDFYDPSGADVKARQSLEPLYFRNGACYALTRSCLLDRQAVFTDNSRGLLIERDLVNIDEPIDLEFARFLVEQRGHS